jgi:hypothetical protein
MSEKVLRIFKKWTLTGNKSLIINKLHQLRSLSAENNLVEQAGAELGLRRDRVGDELGIK